jgi:small GTP-binding protein
MCRVGFRGEFMDEGRPGLAAGAWGAIPEEVRAELKRTLGDLPGGVKAWRRLVEQAVTHLRMTAGRKQRIAIVGPVNVGKSTLYNWLVRRREDAAVVSAVPGSTRVPQEADAGLFEVIDTPGADAQRAVGEVERERALAAARSADVLVVMFDAGRGIGDAESRLFREMAGTGKPVVTVLNKMDLVGKEGSAVLQSAARALGLEGEGLIPLAAKRGRGVGRLVSALVETEPEMVAALGAALPAYRWQLAQTVASRAAGTAAAIAATPLPFMDFIPLVGLQASMVLGIARIYRYRMTLARAREVAAAFGVGFLGRTLFYEVAKLGGPPAWVAAAAVAAGTTFATGYGAAMWFQEGERLSAAGLQRVAKAVSETALGRLRGLGKRRPQRVSLREQIEGALEELTPAATRHRADDGAARPQEERSP